MKQSPANAQSTGSQRRPLLIGTIVAALAAAGYITWRANSHSSEQLDTPESAAPYVCLQCNHVLSLTPADYDRYVHEHRPPRSDDQPTRGARTGLVCEKCGQPALVLAIKCPKDGTSVPKRTRDGQPGKCPKCGWSAQP